MKVQAVKTNAAGDAIENCDAAVADTFLILDDSGVEVMRASSPKLAEDWLVSNGLDTGDGKVL